jgi:hypothetical protein
MQVVVVGEDVGDDERDRRGEKNTEQDRASSGGLLVGCTVVDQPGPSDGGAEAGERPVDKRQCAWPALLDAARWPLRSVTGVPGPPVIATGTAVTWSGPGGWGWPGSSTRCGGRPLAAAGRR